jgi:plastocyanin
VAEVVTRTDMDPGAGTAARTDTGWRRVAVAGCALVVFVVLAVHAVAQELIPPLAIGGAVAIGTIVLLRSGRAPRVAGVLAVLLALFLLAPDLEGTLYGASVVRDPFEFTLNTSGLVAAVLLVVGGIALVVRGARLGGGAVARVLTLLGIAVVPVALLLSLAVRATTPETVAEQGDTAVPIAEFAFPERLQVSAGTNTFYVTNTDPVAHSFSIAELDLDVQAPAGLSGRATVDLVPGEYTYHCRIAGHDFMTGTLVVE